MPSSKNTLILLLSFFIILFYGCEDENHQPTGELRLIVDRDGISNGRLLNETPDKVIISIENSLGEEVKSEVEIGLTVSNDRFILDPIVLPIGDYKITKFLVLGENTEVIYAVPSATGILSNLVEFSLPIDFTIGANDISTFEVEVIDTSDVSIEDLGYASISFTIAPTIDILISLFRISDSNTSFQFVSGQLEYHGDGELIASYDLAEEINQIRIRTDYEKIDLVFRSIGLETVSLTFTRQEIASFKTEPLEVFFELGDSDDINLNEGLFAYYPFNGNANNASGSDHNGEVVGPVLSADRFGNPSSAYSFDGVDDYIDLGNSEDFILGNYESYSISAWVSAVEKPIGAVGAIVTKYISASDNRYFALATAEQQIIYGIWDNLHTEPEQGHLVTTSLQYDQWQHVVAIQSASTVKLFVNGNLVSENTSTIEMRNLSTTANTIIGAYHFSNVLYDGNFEGTIDEVRFYDRALSVDEINALGEL